MPRKGENIYKRKDGRWEGRYIKARSQTGKAIYGYVYAPTYKEVNKNAVRLLSTLNPIRLLVDTSLKVQCHPALSGN